MQKFVNNWERAITLAAGQAECELDLPNGEYRLTLTDAAKARWEIVDAYVYEGSASLARGQEGTDDQEWPSGSVIYCGITSEILQDLLVAVATLREQVFQLTPIAPGYVASWARGGYVFGYSRDGQSSISPLGKIGIGTSVIPGSEMVEGAPGEVVEAVWYNVEAPYFRLAWRSTVGAEAPSAPFSELWLSNQLIAPESSSFFGGYGSDIVAMQFPTAVNPLPAGEVIQLSIY